MSDAHSDGGVSAAAWRAMVEAAPQVTHGNGHSGLGWYMHDTEYPEEGAVFLSTSPAPTAAPEAPTERNALRPDHPLAGGMCSHNLPMTDHCQACAAASPERVALPEQPTGDEYHAANRCVDAAVLHLTGSTEWPDGWMALRDQFLGFIRDALLAHARLRPAAGGGAVATVDPEDLILKCVPGGDSCDPQGVADAIREYFAATAQAGDATNAADGVDTSRVDQPKGGA
jgi:hypothetical protein